MASSRVIKQPDPPPHLSWGCHACLNLLAPTPLPWACVPWCLSPTAICPLCAFPFPGRACSPLPLASLTLLTLSLSSSLTPAQGTKHLLALAWLRSSSWDDGSSSSRPGVGARAAITATTVTRLSRSQNQHVAPCSWSEVLRGKVGGRGTQQGQV